MPKLAKLESRFSKEQIEHNRKLKGFHKKQRSHEKLPADAKPQHGVPQEMPSL